MRKKMIVACYLYMFWFPSSVFGQTQAEIDSFWFMVQERFVNKELQTGLTAWLISVVQDAVPKSTSPSEEIQHVETRPDVQAAIFVELYREYHRNKEGMRVILTELCGSFELGNKTADFISSRYSRNLKLTQELKAADAEHDQQVQRQMEEEQQIERIHDQNEERRKAALNAEWEREAESKKLAQVAFDEWKKINNGASSNDTTFPRLKGGLKAWQKYISRNLTSPSDLQTMKNNGVVVVAFRITIDGDIENVVVKSGIGHGCDELAQKIVEGSNGRWVPAKFKGKPIPFDLMIPLTFVK